MDPYDDYDPEQYVYDESDQEDGGIVYLEDTKQDAQQDPFLPYNHGLELSQSQSQVAVPNILPRKERIRLRKEAEARMMANEQDSFSSGDEDRAEGEQNPFASLLSLLDKQPDEKVVDSSNNRSQHVETTETKGVNEPVAVAAPESEQAQVENGKTEEVVLDNSQPEFPAADDWDFSQQVMTQESTRRSVRKLGVSVQQEGTSGLARELRRQQKKQKQPQRSAVDFIPTTQNEHLFSELEKNRKRAQRNGGKRQKVGGQARRDLSQNTKSKTTSASIVGSRPQHWGRARNAGVPLLKTRALAISPRSSHLAAAVQRKSSRAAKSLSPQQSSDAPRHPRGFSFAPPFFRTKTNQVDGNDAVEEVREVLARSFETPRVVKRMMAEGGAAVESSGGGSAPKRKRGKVKAGPLLQRLKSLKSEVDSDHVRFQSGMYPFAQSAKRYDMSDPRTRAKSRMDVSVLEDPVPWNEHDRVTVLGFIHSFHDKLAGDKRLGCAWLTFTFETAREQKLCRGSQLRIYNAVVVPSKKSPVNIGGLRGDTSCDKTVLCTQLCELYPESLPPLPSSFNTVSSGNEAPNGNND